MLDPNVHWQFFPRCNHKYDTAKLLEHELFEVWWEFLFLLNYLFAGSPMADSLQACHDQRLDIAT